MEKSVTCVTCLMKVPYDIELPKIKTSLSYYKKIYTCSS